MSVFSFLWNINTGSQVIEHVTHMLNETPEGLWELQIKKPKRTRKQNDLIHALFRDLAVELNGLGIEMRFGNFRADFTEVTAKEFFKDAYLFGKGTSQATTQELADAIDKMIKNINEIGGQLSIRAEHKEAYTKLHSKK